MYLFQWINASERVSAVGHTNRTSYYNRLLFEKINLKNICENGFAGGLLELD